MIRFIYMIVSTMLGFLEHPYKTMQSVVEKEVPFIFIFFPFVLCVVGWIAARYLAWLFLSLIPLLGLWWFLEVWWLIFWGLWQVTLLYLYIRFSSVKE